MGECRRLPSRKGRESSGTLAALDTATQQPFRMAVNLAEREMIVAGGFIPRENVKQFGLRRGATLGDRREG